MSNLHFQRHNHCSKSRIHISQKYTPINSIIYVNLKDQYSFKFTNTFDPRKIREKEKKDFPKIPSPFLNQSIFLHNDPQQRPSILCPCERQRSESEEESEKRRASTDTSTCIEPKRINRGVHKLR